MDKEKFIISNARIEDEIKIYLIPFLDDEKWNSFLLDFFLWIIHL